MQRIGMLCRLGALGALAVALVGCQPRASGPAEVADKSSVRAAVRVGSETQPALPPSRIVLGPGQTMTLVTPEFDWEAVVYLNGHTEFYCYWRRYLRGDLNCDGSVNFRDINPFVSYLSNFTTWQRDYPNCNPFNGDINQDCHYPSVGDIQAFIDLIGAGPQ